MAQLNNEIIKKVFIIVDDIKVIYKMIVLSKKFLDVYRNMDVQIFLRKVNTKVEKLQVFVNFYKYLPIQGTLAWKLSKDGSKDIFPTIGGSEYKKAMANPRTFLIGKLGLNKRKFQGNTMTNWGNLFEEPSAQILDILLKASSVETGSIPGLKHTIEGHEYTVQSYSPDRLGVINKRKLLSLLRSDVNFAAKQISSGLFKYIRNFSGDSLIILDEFKNPSNRIPDGTIPKQYEDQPKVGTSTLKFIDLCLFVDSIFRKCSVNNLLAMDKSYDAEYHSSDLENHPAGFELPVFGGLIFFYEIRKKKVKIITDQVPETQISVEELKKKIEEEVEMPGSDLYQKKFSQENLLLYFAFLDRWLKHLNREEKVRTIIEICLPLSRGMIVDDWPSLINGIITLNGNIQSEPDYGLDFGTIDNNTFNLYLYKSITNRHEENGVKIYHSAGMLRSDAYQTDLPNIRENYLDRSLPLHLQRKKWFNNNVREFNDFCKVNGYHPIGVVPWKLFRMSIIPIIPTLNHLDEKKIRTIAEVVHAIRKVTAEIEDIEEKKKKSLEILDDLCEEYFGIRKKKIEKQEEAKVSFSFADFGDL